MMFLNLGGHSQVFSILTISPMFSKLLYFTKGCVLSHGPHLFKNASPDFLLSCVPFPNQPHHTQCLNLLHIPKSLLGCDLASAGSLFFRSFLCYFILLFFYLFLLVISFVTFPSPTNSFNPVAGQSSLVNLQSMLIFLTFRKKKK